MPGLPPKLVVTTYAPTRRWVTIVLLVLLACLAAGCSKNRPGEKIVAPLPSTVVGTVPKQQQASVPAQYQHHSNGDA